MRSEFIPHLVNLVNTGSWQFKSSYTFHFMSILKKLVSRYRSDIFPIFIQSLSIMKKLIKCFMLLQLYLSE